MKKAVTLVDIAKACGTSNVTVSNALSGRKGVSDEMREKILKTAKKMGYTAGRTESKAESGDKTVGVLIPSKYFNPGGSFYWSLYNCLVRKLKSKNMLCIMENLEQEDEETLKPPIMLKEGRISALVSLGQVSDNYARMLTGSIGGIIMLDYYIPSLKADCVISNSYIGAYKLCSYLIKMGHKKIGFIGNRFATSSITDRYMGYLRAMIENGLDAPEKWTLDDRDNAGAIEIKFPDELPTAFVCNCDETAYRAIKQLKAKGYSVPDDISIVGYDNYLMSEVSEPAITTIDVNAEDMAELTVSALLERRADPDRPYCTKIYKGELVIKQSVRKI